VINDVSYEEKRKRPPRLRGKKGGRDIEKKYCKKNASNFSSRGERKKKVHRGKALSERKRME